MNRDETLGPDYVRGETESTETYIRNDAGISVTELVTWIKSNVTHSDDVVVGVIPDAYGSWRPVHFVQYVNGELRIYLRKRA